MIKKFIYFITICGLFSCASTINTTGSFELDSEIRSISIICISPNNVVKFSNKLCDNLKSNLNKSGIETRIEVISEMTPKIDPNQGVATDLDSVNYEINISHIRVSLYNGKPCNTLMNIELIDKKNYKTIWKARIYTNGSNITGPGNPEKVAIEIINQMKSDGLKI